MLRREVTAEARAEIQPLLARINGLEGELTEALSSNARAELESLNEVGKHLSVLKESLEDAMVRVDDFFRELPVMEQERGRLGAYDQSLTELRSIQRIISTSYAELESQRLQWNRLVARLRSQL